MVMPDNHWGDRRTFVRTGSIVISFVGSLLLCSVLSIVYYDDKWVSAQADVGENSSSDVRKVAEKLRLTLKIFGVLAFFLLLGTLLLPIWMSLSHSATDPGLQGHFFFQYIADQTLMFVVSVVALWGQVQANGSRENSKESSNSPTHSVAKGKFPSFGVDDLNGSPANV